MKGFAPAVATVFHRKYGDRRKTEAGLPSRSSRADQPVFALEGYDVAASAAPRERRLVGPGRLELPTSRLSGVRSNQLSYGPSGVEARDRPGKRERLAIASPAMASPSKGERQKAGDEEERETKTAASRIVYVFGEPIEVVRSLEAHP